MLILNFNRDSSIFEDNVFIKDRVIKLFETWICMFWQGVYPYVDFKVMIRLTETVEMNALNHRHTKE